MKFNLVFQIGQNLFLSSPICGLLLSAKLLNFKQKILIRTIHHAILKYRHFQESNNANHVFSLERSQKALLARLLIVTKITTRLPHIIFTSLYTYPKLIVMVTL